MIFSKNQRKQILSLIVITFFLISFTLTAQLVKSEGENYTKEQLFTEAFESKIVDLMDISKSPSLSVGIVYQDEIVYMNAFGEQSHINTSYSIGSTTKSVIATCVLQLYDRGIIDIYDPINNYLPFEITNINSPETDINFFHLMTHTSGLESTPEYNENIWNKNISFPDYFYEFLHINGLKYDTEIFHGTVGHLYAYENINFDLLTGLVYFITNQSFPQYLAENVFIPMGVNNSHYSYLDYPEGIPVKIYDMDISDNLVEYPQYDWIGYGGGSLRSAVMDITHFLYAHMNEGEFNGFQLLNKSTVELMHSRHSGDYGLGWMWDRPELMPTPRLEGHGGLSYGTMSYMNFNPDSKVGVVMLSNNNYYDSNSTFNWRDKKDDIFRYVFKTALKLNQTVTGTSFANLFTITLTVLSTSIFVMILRKKKK